MTVKELFEVVDARCYYNDITIIDNSYTRSVNTFKYPRDGINYIEKMLNKFGNRVIVPNGVAFDSNPYDIGYITVEVK